tara:strand:- start:485 stop:922 length:438 start_codon:yes stop_codon:yes gene_type:complete
MKNYQLGKIYRLFCLDNNLVYIGSTVQPLNSRYSQHKKDFNDKNIIRYSQSKYLFGSSNEVKIELIEEYPCNNSKELNRREGEYIKNMNCINKYIAGRTKDEYYQDTRLKQIAYSKSYYYKNREYILKRKREKTKQLNQETTNLL